jgi:hypothetical protein
MEFILGVITGLVMAGALAALAIWLIARRSMSAPTPESGAPASAAPAVMVAMVESFLDAQLREAIAGTAAIPPGGQAAAEPKTRADGAGEGLRPQIRDTILDIQPGLSALLTSTIAIRVLGIHVEARPVTRLAFYMDGGRVGIRIKDVHIGRVNIPRPVVYFFIQDVIERAQARLNRTLAQIENDTGVVLTDLSTTDDLMVIKFASGPARSTQTEPPEVAKGTSGKPEHVVEARE